MRYKRIICDFCHNTVDNRRETGYIIKRKQFWIDTMYKKMDVCQDCMRKILKAVEFERSKHE